MKQIISKLKSINPKWKKFKGKKKIIIPIIVLLAASAGVITYSKLGNKKVSPAQAFTSAKVTRGDIAFKISGSGTVEPVSRYEIISLVRGEILSCNFEEGDYVNEGDILYRIDSTDVQNNIQKQRNSIEKTQLTAKTNAENLESLKVRAPISGTLTDFNVKAGDTARADNVGTITNSSSLIATVPFNSSQLAKIRTGDSATVVSALYMTSLSGTVTYKSNIPSGSADGSALYDVEISLQNPGSLSNGTSVGATVHTSSGDVTSPASGTIKNAETASVIPKVSGKVTKVYAKNNTYVSKGDILFQIDDTEYLQAQKKTNLELQDLQLSLQSSIKELENYNIKAPISGVVISKEYKTGDTIGNSQNSSASLMTIANTSAMVFNLDVDELEISKIAVGQTADITADALPDQTFTGAVTKIAKEGTSQNGVTTYQVELTIAEPGNLISGMNVNAEIIVEESKDTLLLPVSAVSGIRNGQGTVMVKAHSEAPQDGKQPPKPNAASQGRAGGFQDTAGAPQGSAGAPQGSAGAPQGSAGAPQGRAGGFQGTPKGASNAENSQYTIIRVEVGISNSDYVEILSGLNEGDEVFYTGTAPTGQGFIRGGAMNMGSMHMGGGVPTGGGGGAQGTQGRQSTQSRQGGR